MRRIHKKYRIHKKHREHRIHKIHRRKTYIFYYPQNMRDQTNTHNRRIRRTYLFYCPVDVSDLWKHNTNMKYMSTPLELQYKAVISTQTCVAKAFVDVNLHYCNISICSNDLNLRLLLREVKKWFSVLSRNLRKYSTPFFYNCILSDCICMIY